MMDHDEDFLKTLEDPFYSRLREALYGINGSKRTLGAEELEQGVNILPGEDLVGSKQDETKDVSQEDKSNHHADNYASTNGLLLNNSKAFGEIEEVDSEETEHIEEDDKIVNDIPIEGVNTSSLLEGKRNVRIRPEVEQALETLEKVISIVREYGLHSNRPSPSFAHEESPCMEKGDVVDSYSPKLHQLDSKNEVSIEASNKDTLEGTSREALGTNSDIPSLR